MAILATYDFNGITVEDAYIRIQNYRIINQPETTDFMVEYDVKVYSSELSRENGEDYIDYMNGSFVTETLPDDVTSACYNDLEAQFDKPEDV